LITKIASLFALITGKNVYDTIDNKVFISKLLEHPNSHQFFDVIMDVVSESTSSDIVAKNVGQYRGILKTGLESFTRSGEPLNFSEIMNIISSNGNAQNPPDVQKQVVVNSTPPTQQQHKHVDAESEVDHFDFSD
jgi:hypothetical protein